VESNNYRKHCKPDTNHLCSPEVRAKYLHYFVRHPISFSLKQSWRFSLSQTLQLASEEKKWELKEKEARGREEVHGVGRGEERRDESTIIFESTIIP
jgi:hypothetical protein